MYDGDDFKTKRQEKGSKTLARELCEITFARFVERPLLQSWNWYSHLNQNNPHYPDRQQQIINNEKSKMAAVASNCDFFRFLNVCFLMYDRDVLQTIFVSTQEAYEHHTAAKTTG